MKTDALIAELAKDLPPVRRGAVERTLGWALVGGTLLSAVIMVCWLGLRPMNQAMGAWSFWMKGGYTIALAGVGWLMTRKAARPAGRLGWTPYALAGVFVALVALGATQVMPADAQVQARLVLGSSWTVCPWRILALSTPILAGLMLAIRGQAPTRPWLAGAAAGLLAGGLGASVYGLYCQETSAAFVAAWYSLGIALSAGLGALAAPRLLRW